MRFVLGLIVLLPAAAFAQIQPGMWETSSTTKMAQMPDLPPAIAERLMKGRTVTVRHCVTPEDAAKGPRQLLTEQKSCAIDHYDMKGGRFDAKMTCSGMTITSTGSYTPASMTGDSQVSGNGVNMSAHVESRRTGSC